jgi:hypothetical protein
MAVLSIRSSDPRVCGTDWVAYLGPGGLQSVEMIITLAVRTRRPSGGQVVCQYLMQRLLHQVAGTKGCLLLSDCGKHRKCKRFVNRKKYLPSEEERRDN